MHVKRVAGALGAEILGINLVESLAEDMQVEIRQLLNEHEVLFFRDQPIEPAQQRDLASIFGPLQTHPAYGTSMGFLKLWFSKAPKRSRQKLRCGIRI
jgi:taurine dioxygenase